MNSVTLKTETVGLQFLNTTRYSNTKEDHHSINKPPWRREKLWLLSEQDKQCTYLITLLPASLIISQRKHNNAFCVYCCWATCRCQLYKNIKFWTTILNLYHQQQCKLHVQDFVTNYIPKNIRSCHALDINAVWKQNNLCLLMVLVTHATEAKQIVMSDKSLSRLTILQVLT
jgi:hypothetical protein